MLSITSAESCSMQSASLECLKKEGNIFFTGFGNVFQKKKNVEKQGVNILQGTTVEVFFAHNALKCFLDHFVPSYFRI